MDDQVTQLPCVFQNITVNQQFIIKFNKFGETANKNYTVVAIETAIQNTAILIDGKRIDFEYYPVAPSCGQHQY